MDFISLIRTLFRFFLLGALFLILIYLFTSIIPFLKLIFAGVNTVFYIIGTHEAMVATFWVAWALELTISIIEKVQSYFSAN